MATGTVKWFNLQKGYGFIEQEGEDEVFVHYSKVEPYDVHGGSCQVLFEGQKVEFQTGPGQTEGKLQALNVKVMVQ